MYIHFKGYLVHIRSAKHQHSVQGSNGTLSIARTIIKLKICGCCYLSLLALRYNLKKSINLVAVTFSISDQTIF